jgi:N-carbamoyl-L-amino-acid hydrolase
MNSATVPGGTPPVPAPAAGTPAGINGTRLCERLMALAQIGATPAGGVNRQALSPGEIAAWRLVISWARGAGLEAATDAAGNLYLILRGADPALPPLLSGSHLDTQPTGGRFDGAYGVMAALEAATALAEAGVQLPRDVIAVAWMNEEGSRFAPGMMGSEAFAGVRGLDEIRAAHDADGISVASALDALHGAFPELRRLPLGFTPAAYVEAHIEQGPVLEAEHKIIGVVTAIQGKKTCEVTVSGDKGHAGTLAMAERRDALAAFARIAAALHAEIGGHDTQVKFTIGRLRIEPNAPSVVPERAVFSIDLRHPDNAVLDMLGERIAVICAREAGPCAVEIKPLVDAPSNGFDAAIQDIIEAAARDFGHPSMRLLSAAGHDARHLAPLCPSAMIFIPCRGGVSHAEHEWAEPAHVIAGAQVLLATLLQLASAPEAQP